MRLLMPALSLIALASAPLSAAGLAETHRELAVPPGKIHAKAFRPVAPQPCSVVRADPSGNRPAATRPLRSAEACSAQESAARG